MTKADLVSSVAQSTGIEKATVAAANAMPAAANARPIVATHRLTS